MLLPLLLAFAAQVPDTTHLVIVATTDVHGHATAWDYLADAPFPGGLARAATVVDSLRANYPGQVVLVDAGDLIQGDPFAAYFAREAPRDPHPILDAMGGMSYDAATPGNHEFNWGVPFMQRALNGAAFPYVSANIYALPGDTLMFPAWTVVQRGGVRVAITGFTTPGVMVWDRDLVRNRARVARVRAAAARVLRQVESRSDFTIALIHSGLGGSSSYDTTGVGPENAAEELAAGPVRPDLVVVGHSHREIADTVINGVHFVQPRNFAQSLSVVHVTLSREVDGWKPIRVRAQLIPLRNVPPAEAITRRLAAAHDAVRRFVAVPVGAATAAMPATTARAEPSALVNYINEVERRRAGTELASTPVFNTRAGFPQGDITLAQVAAVYPYENTLIGIRVTGAQLKAYLEQSARYFTVDERGRIGINDSIPGYNYDIVSGAEYAIDLRLPPGDRIRGLSVRGRPVHPEDQFTLALNSYRAGGGGGFSMLAGAPVIYNKGENLRELLLEDLRTRGLLRAEDFGTRNWRIVPDEAALAVRRLFLPTAGPARPQPPRDTTVLRIFSINDLHGALEPRMISGAGRVGGLAVIKRLMDSLAALCDCPDLRLDGGDEMQGTLASNLEHGRATILAMNRLGIDAAAIGNHEFDWSVDTLQRRMAESRYPWLAANIVDSATGERPAWAIPWRMLDAGGLKVGVVGYVTPETPSIVKRGNLDGLRFLGPEALREPLEQVRRQQPDLVVILAHEGLGCTSDTSCSGPIFDLARQLDSTRVDLIVAGHWDRLVNTRVNGITILLAGSRGRAVAVTDVVRTAVGGRELRSRIIIPYADSIGSDSGMAALVLEARHRTDSLANQPVASLKIPMPRGGNQFPLGNLMADAFRNALRTDIAITNNGGIRAGLPAGPVGYAQVFEVDPFGNQLVRLRLTGRQVRELIEAALVRGSPSAHVAGLRATWDSSRPAGRRVREIRLLNGRRLDDRATYTLATSDFLAGGKDGFDLLAAIPAESTGITTLEAIVTYLRRLPQPVAPPEDARLIPAR